MDPDKEFFRESMEIDKRRRERNGDPEFVQESDVIDITLDDSDILPEDLHSGARMALQVNADNFDDFTPEEHPVLTDFSIPSSELFEAALKLV